MLAIVGGTGLYKLPGLQTHGLLTDTTPFGNPSGPIHKGDLGGTPILFLARHGEGHRLLPSEINYRANIFALKRAGARAILAVSAVGSLSESIAPGDLVAIDQYLDFTKGIRSPTFFGDGIVAHVLGARPVSELLLNCLRKAAEKTVFANRKIHIGGTYSCIEGPRLGTRAESLMFRALGAQVVGMTHVPECFLALEAQMAYASLGVVTDFDSWQEDPSLHVEVSKVFSLYSQSLDSVLELSAAFIEQFSKVSLAKCPSRTALKDSFLTPESSWPTSSAEWINVLRE